MLERKYENFYEKIFFITLGMIAIIDSTNGYLLSNYNVSVSVGYRMIALMVFLFFSIYKNNIKNYVPMLIIGAYLGISTAINLLNNNAIGSIVYEYTKISKLIFIIAIIESFKNVYKNKYKQGMELIDKVIKYNLILFPICILVPSILGIGLNTYDSYVGSKGFFNANNEIGLILSVLCVFAMDRLYNKVSIYNIVIFLAIFFSTVSLGSKVGILVPFIVTFIYFIKSAFNRKERSSFFKLISYLCIAIVLITVLFFGDLLYEVIERQVIYYNVYENTVENPLFTLLLSGRDKFVAIMMSTLMTSNYLLVHLLFGYSAYIKESIIGRAFYGIESLKAVEMDFFDTFFSYGLVGTILIYGYFLKIIIKNYSFKDYNMKYTISAIIILILAFIAGHGFYGAMSGSILAVVMCGMIGSESCLAEKIYKDKIDVKGETEMEKCSILGMKFTLGNMDYIVNRVIKRIKENKKTFIITPNVDFLTRYNENKEFKEVCDKADVSIIDGMPVYWIAKAMGHRDASRIAGIDFCAELAKKSKDNNFSLFLLGGENDVANEAAEVLIKKYNANISGALSPKIGFEKEENSLNEVLNIINNANADIILAGMSSPIQENFIVNNMDKINAKVFIGVGGSFNAFAGRVTRAPKIMQKLGLEWLHRVMQEPSRLASRYAKNAVDLSKLILKSSFSR